VALAALMGSMEYAVPPDPEDGRAYAALGVLQALVDPPVPEDCLAFVALRATVGHAAIVACEGSPALRGFVA
jgi:hypothetical protein